jgi:hypothetical protein
MKSSDIAALLVQGMQQQGNGNTDIGWHTGVIDAWDDLTGLNTVVINGNEFSNLRVLSTGAVQPFQPGDVAGIMRVGTQYFILGKVRAAGAGAGERIASARVASLQNAPISASMSDIPGSPGPSVTLYVGSARRILVIHSCEVGIVGSSANALESAGAYQGVAVSGVSSLPAETAVTSAYLEGNLTNSASVSATTLVTAANGLQQGQNTFTCKYRAFRNGSLVPVVNNRVLTVIPF